MKSFLHIVGALAIGAMIAAGLTFPALLIGAAIGYIIIQESMSKPKYPPLDLEQTNYVPPRTSGIDSFFDSPTDKGTW